MNHKLPFRTCIVCNEFKPKKEFYGTQKTCKECTKQKRPPIEGYIYIITNPAWPNYVKIGRSNNPSNRLNTYQTGSPLRDYSIYYSRFVKDLAKIESYFAKVYGTDTNEWYKIAPIEANNIIDYLCELHGI